MSVDHWAVFVAGLVLGLSVPLLAGLLRRLWAWLKYIVCVTAYAILVILAGIGLMTLLSSAP